ncbi:L-threonylcarbamoyladenylate synthase [Holospora undulata]|uniref:Threonylcarbamoyl-AMP synthase n=1 Tax=Holospora undulata HU1 TaxID=1321371 RepID=A0A061JH72_9PROT|nr:L-threonylcarbamoyladenylate synthase [Holospora undulata]ETZ04558.1 threonylcarbamoyl-AMP synthase [Holospora undulata HU1]
MLQGIALLEAVTLLKKNQIVALPTETVYGLAGRAESVEAVEKIYEVKRRPISNPLIVHYATQEMALKDGVLCEQGKKLVKKIWPGPLTVVVDKSPDSRVVSLAHCGLASFAIRVPNHPVMHYILNQVGPLAAPSANPSGGVSPTTAEHVHQAFSGTVPVLDAGPCVIGVESTIIDLRFYPFSILRPGYWTLEKLLKEFPDISFQEAQSSDIITPGTSFQHYSPKKPLFLNVSPPFDLEMGIIGFGPLQGDLPTQPFVQLSVKKNIEEAARNIFSALHYLDRSEKCLSIGIVPIPSYGIGAAINDRLTRAALKDHS